jgi:hypothetical protein
VAGTFDVASRLVIYTVDLEGHSVYLNSPLAVQFYAWQDVLLNELDNAEGIDVVSRGEDAFMSLSNAVENWRPARAGLQPVALPMFVFEDAREAIAAFTTAVAPGDTGGRLAAFLDSSEAVVPVFDSAPERFKTIHELAASTGTRAAVVLGSGSAAGLMSHASVPELLLFYAGGTVLIRVIDPVLSEIGSGLAAAVRRRLNKQSRT